MQAEFENWAREAAPYFQTAGGLSGAFALQAARLFIAFWGAGLNPRIASGFRDPAHQRALQARWDAGDRAGLRARPATTSKHMTMNMGRPAATAIDMPCSDDKKGAAIAGNMGVGAGWNFADRDPGHYFLNGG